MSGSYVPTGASTVAADGPRPPPPAVRSTWAVATSPMPGRVRALGDATVPDADIDEALAAAAALWQVAVQNERG